MERIGVIGIVVCDTSVSVELQRIISEYAEIIIGRMGIPDKSTGISAISLIVKGTNERINALCGKLGRVASVSAKSALMNIL